MDVAENVGRILPDSPGLVLETARKLARSDGDPAVSWIRL